MINDAILGQFLMEVFMGHVPYLGGAVIAITIALVALIIMVDTFLDIDKDKS